MKLFENESENPDLQKAVLIGVSLRGEAIEESMEELGNLAQAAGATVVDSLIQNRDRIDPATFIGKGKIEELENLASFHDANLIIFNDELSGAQLRNIEAVIDLKVIDRTALILDIFAVRARSRIAKLQVELAQLRYSLPRLIGLGQSLSRTGGGIGTRGPGEQKLELDRRKINKRIADIRHLLKEAEKDRETQRAQRRKHEIPLVALVGYTNAGKSTLMNRLLETFDAEGGEVYTEDMLFATLDTSVRRIVLDNNRTFLLSDTVGFVSKLPHSLIEAFKATLEEVVEADLLIHLVDASSPHYDRQIAVTEEVLGELGAGDKPQILCFNKADRVQDPIYTSVKHLTIAALTGLGVPELIETVSAHLFTDLQEVEYLVPYSDGQVLNELMTHCEVLSTEHEAQGTRIRVIAGAIVRGRYAGFEQ